jgi:AcrR family transcriptional regulator
VTKQAGGKAKISGIEGRRRAAQLEGGEAYVARRKELVEAAAAVFREKGFEAATLNDVAERLNTDRASLYYYVGSKDDLLQEIVRSVLDSNVSMAEGIRKRKGSALEKLQLLITEMMGSFEKNYPHMYVYTEDMNRIAKQDSEWARTVVHATKRFESIVVGIIEKGKDEGTIRHDLNTEIAALAVFGMVNWTHRWFRPGHKYNADQVAREFSRLCLEGFAVERPALP